MTPGSVEKDKRAGAAPLVRRTNLVRELENGSQGPLTLVAAPAGSGKTMLVREWLESRGSRAPWAWVTVERGECDQQRFWNSIIGALHAVAPEAVRRDAPQPAPSYDGAATVERLVRELARLEQDVLVVIDDLHEIFDSEVLRGLTYLVDRLPAALHLVLISRHDPPLGLHKRRLAGEVSEIRGDQLRFTLAETTQMLQAGGVELSTQGIELLHSRTEGWVAGLRLAGMSLARQPDPDRFVEEFSGSERNVTEYLLAEVLDTQRPEIRRLLMRSSLLERVNGALGDLLTGDHGTERHLRALADTGVFVVTLDPARTWFRFHRLFADMLLLELRHTEPGELARLHAIASEWYDDNGYAVEAIVHARAAGDKLRTDKLLIRHYFSLVLDGRLAAAHLLVQEHAEGRMDASPELAAVVAADELTSGSLEQAAALLALAEQHAGSVPDERRHRFDMAVLITRISLARRRGDLTSVIHEANLDGIQRTLANRGDVDMYSDVTAMVLMGVGVAEIWSGQLAEGVSHLEDARELAESIGRPYIEVFCRAHLAYAMSWRSFTEAAGACRTAIALAERHGWGCDSVIAPALLTLGTAHIQAGRLEDGEQWLARTDEAMRTELEPAVGFLMHLAAAVLQIARGRYLGAIDSCLEGERLGLRLVGDSPLALQMKSSKLYAMVRAGQLAAVRESLTAMTERERDSGEIREVLAAVALAEGDGESAVEFLAPTLAGDAELHHRLVLIRSLLLDAQAREALGDQSAVDRAVERALELAESDSLVLPFMYTESRQLLDRHPRHSTAHGAFLAETLDVLSGRRGPQHRQPDALSDELTEAETRILGFLPTNLPVAAIAAEIYLSANTVKTHMRHIYAKLGAHSRVEAVDKARTLGLLGRSARLDRD